MSNISIAAPAMYQSPLNRQRGDKFIMVFSVPDILKEQKSNSIRSNSRIIPNSLQFSIYGTVVPDIKVPHKDVPYAGQVLKVSSFARPSYQPMEVNFMIDNMFNNYWVIYKWLNILNDAKKSLYTSNIKQDEGILNKYSTSISIFGLDEYNNRVIEFKYSNSFPTSLGGIKYSDRNPKEIESTFEFAFFQFEPILL